MRRTAAIVCALLCGLLWGYARAADAKVAVYALHVGYNAAPEGSGLRELRYADDDALKFHVFFRPFAEASVLLTNPDAATAARLGDSEPKAPTLAQLRRTVAAIRTSIAEARRRGDSPIVFFTYSGHGASDSEGVVHLTLADGKLTQMLLYQEIVQALDADFMHLVIDACHAEAVVGGRGEKNAELVALGAQELRPTLAAYPHVGTLLAASADSETHEWSRVESGLFSHEVLSALSGAADADQDGRVSYDEVYAFVMSARSRMSDPRARVDLRVSAPPTDPRVPLVDDRWLTRMAILRGQADELGHFYVERDDGLRLSDAHVEGFRPFRMFVPAARALHLRHARGESTFSLAPGETRDLALLGDSAGEPVARGSLLAALEVGWFQAAYSPSYYRGFSARPPALVKQAPASTPPRAMNPSLKPAAFSAAATVAGTAFGFTALSTVLAIMATQRWDALRAREDAAPADVTTAERDRQLWMTAAITGAAVTAGFGALMLWLGLSE